MKYNVDFDSLDGMYNSMAGQTNTWMAELDDIKTKLQILADSTNMSGAAADNVKLYIKSVHFTIIGLLSQLIALHSSNCLLYKRDYQSNVDRGLHAKIKESEINDIKKKVVANNKDAIAIDESIAYVLRGIKDIFYVSYRNISDVDASHISVTKFLTELDQEIKNLENTHFNNDFINSTRMINSLKSFINEQRSCSRSYKTDFSIDKLSSSASFLELYNSAVEISKEFDGKSDAINTAIENENERIADLQEEYEERQKKAKIINWAVTGVCIVGSIAAIAATGGAATPLVVGGISAVSGAFIAGTGNLTSQYVQHGNLFENSDKIDWASFGGDVVIAGVTGFVTGYVGGVVGDKITKFAQGTQIGKNLLSSTNAVTRIGTGAAIGSVSEVGSGIVSRGAGTFISSGFNGKEALDDAFDVKNIALDAVLGGTSGGVEQYSSIKKAQNAADNAALDYNSKRNPFETGKENGLENIKQTKNGGVDFSDSDYILRTESGEPIQVKIKSTGNRAKDYKQAEKILKEEYGIDIDFKSMRTGQNKTHVWNHMDDYNALTNETTMQFIEIDAHKAIGNHAGSASQYHVAHGEGYGKQAIDVNYDGLDILDYISPVLNDVDLSKEYVYRDSSNMPIFNIFN